MCGVGLSLKDGRPERGSCSMPKLKTHRGLAKRIRVTKKKKLKRMQAFHRHLMTGKRGGRKRRLRHGAILKGAQAKCIGRLLGLC